MGKIQSIISKYFSVALKGFGMGAANVVPGVSGGTIALITGIYTDIVDAISAFTDRNTWKALLKGNWSEFWKSIKGAFLLALGVGIIVSIFSLAKLMTLALEHYPILTWAFFFGLILASAVIMFRNIKLWKGADIAALVVGILLGVGVCTLSPTNTSEDLWFIFVCGAISICTMILPGVSGSFVLLILGKYEYIMNAVTELNLPVLAVFAVGCVVGILAFAKLLHWLLARWEQRTMIVLLGFVLGSLIRIWPWSDKVAAMEAQLLRGNQSGILDMQIPAAIACCVGGIVLVLLIEMMGKRSKRAE